MAENTSIYLSSQSVEWALKNIKKFGDTDLLPVPFEYDAVEHDMVAAVSALTQLDISRLQTRSFRKFLVPKPRSGFRIVHQLDPQDTIILLALMYEEAEKIESFRISRGEKRACSNRIDLRTDGNLFTVDHGWNDFHEKTEQLIESQNYTHIVTADIADFYNQIYTHKIANNLETSLVDREKAEVIENFLLNLSARKSRGIPVGPIASVLLAEVCLIDVDIYLKNQNFECTRYVDDFRVFVSSAEEGQRVLHDLTKYLYESHRLTLQTHKTKILTIDDFKTSDFLDPEREEEREKTERVNTLMEDIFGDTSSAIPTRVELESAEERDIVLEALRELFSVCLSKESLPLGLTRYVFRRSRALRTKIIYNDVLERFNELQPVLRDVINYITKVSSQQDIERTMSSFYNFFDNSEFKFLAYSVDWISHAVLEGFPEEANNLRQFYNENNISLPVRTQALLAEKSNDISWIQGVKENINSYPPWDKRAIIRAASILPRTEKRIWGKSLLESGDWIEKAVIRKYLLQ